MPVICHTCPHVAAGYGAIQGKYRCHPCRRLSPTPPPQYSVACAYCSTVFTSGSRVRRYCSVACSSGADSIAKQIRPKGDCRVRRIQREHAAPGLTLHGRKKLSTKWQRQGLTCAYCPAKATTVDHVVPLVRGGTNYEGNLVPCCKACNSSKSGFLVIEWRTGRRLPRMTSAVVWAARVKVAKPPKVKQPKPTHPCPICHAMTSRQKYCTDGCALVANSAYSLERYRIKAGLQSETGRVILRRQRKTPSDAITAQELCV